MKKSHSNASFTVYLIQETLRTHTIIYDASISCFRQIDTQVFGPLCNHDSFFFLVRYKGLTWRLVVTTQVVLSYYNVPCLGSSHSISNGQQMKFGIIHRFLTFFVQFLIGQFIKSCQAHFLIPMQLVFLFNFFLAEISLSLIIIADFCSREIILLKIVLEINLFHYAG